MLAIFKVCSWVAQWRPNITWHIHIISYKATLSAVNIARVSWWLCPWSPRVGASDPGLSPLMFMEHTWPGQSQGDSMTLSLYLLEKRLSLITSGLKYEDEWLAETFLIPIKLQAKVNRIEGRRQRNKDFKKISKCYWYARPLNKVLFEASHPFLKSFRVKKFPFWLSQFGLGFSVTATK